MDREAVRLVVFFLCAEPDALAFTGAAAEVRFEQAGEGQQSYMATRTH